MNDIAGRVRVARCLVAAATVQYEVIASIDGTIAPTSYRQLPLHALVNNTLVASSDKAADHEHMPSAFAAAIRQAEPLVASYYYFTQNVKGTIQMTREAGSLAAKNTLNDTLENFCSIDPMEQAMATMGEFCVGIIKCIHAHILQ